MLNGSVGDFRKIIDDFCIYLLQKTKEVLKYDGTKSF